MDGTHLWAYERIDASLTDGGSVLLDGGVSSEVCRALGESPRDAWALYDHTARVLEVHRQYAAAGCDVISTNTWGLLGSIGTARGSRPGRTGLPAWTVATQDAVDLARRGIALAGRTGHCAVAFSLNDADPLLLHESSVLELLWGVKPPDLVLIETLTALPSPGLLGAIAEIAANGFPVWVSLRRLGTFPDEAPGQLASALEDLAEAGVRAVLANCIPFDRASDAVAELAAATALPVGCYPRLDEPLDPACYGELSKDWLAHGARIVGGCCGVGPGHIAAVRRQLAPSVATRP